MLACCTSARIMPPLTHRHAASQGISLSRSHSLCLSSFDSLRSASTTACDVVVSWDAVASPDAESDTDPRASHHLVLCRLRLTCPCFNALRNEMRKEAEEPVSESRKTQQKSLRSLFTYASQIECGSTGSRVCEGEREAMREEKKEERRGGG